MTRESHQSRLVDLPVDSRTARRLAEDAVLEEIGSIPTIGSVLENEKEFVFEIEATYPRVIVDETTGEPSKTRFLRVGKVGEVHVSKLTGKVERPPVYEVQKAIRSQVQRISATVEQALVKVAADNFAILPFPVHLHTPFLDALSWLLVRDRIRLAELADVPEAPAEKLRATLEPLQRVQLIDIQDNVVIPGPILIGIEENYQGTNVQLEKALAHFFREGYVFIDSVRQVLGPHLSLAGILYERAVESGRAIPLSYEQIHRDFVLREGNLKMTKLPRYLVQLEGIGLVSRHVHGGKTFWKASPGVFGSLARDELLQPIEHVLA